MDAKEELKKIQAYTVQIDALAAEAERLDELLKKDKGCGMIQPSSRDKILLYRKQLNQKIVEIIELKSGLLKAIDRIPNIYYQIVLMKRYFDLLSFEDIAIDFDRRKRWAEEMNANAIAALQEILDSEEF